MLNDYDFCGFFLWLAESCQDKSDSTGVSCWVCTQMTYSDDMTDTDDIHGPEKYTRRHTRLAGLEANLKHGVCSLLSPHRAYIISTTHAVQKELRKWIQMTARAFRRPEQDFCMIPSKVCSRHSLHRSVSWSVALLVYKLSFLLY